MNEYYENRVNYRILSFFVLLTLIGAIALVGVLWWRISDNNARVAEARALQSQAQAEIEKIKPDIIVARSQANINNSLAVTSIKDSALIILVIIFLIKESTYAKPKRQ
jgi:hypothetical protein